ncbi:hypothetical protein J437_LFUL002543 [Ladona fulva]|uniref:DDE Tnp4 domain-containing protein n=1 Tax=Ladona fulva TaxID=123851 RepID=A0A8K0KSX3_LADFU|nr:hypothetical protein J437_LFUL002543 [Ladona fulva]
MAVADANYNFIYAGVGCQGCISDGGVFQHTSLYKRIQLRPLQFPDAEALQSRGKLVPFVFVADEHKPGSSSPVFNYRRSRARRIIENFFGIMSAKFRIFLKAISLHPDKVETVSLTCIYLHNYLRRNAESKSFYSPPGTFDSENSDNNLIPGSWRKEVKDPHALHRIGRQ